MNQNDWSFQEEDAFNVALSQRTDELYRVANATPDEDGCIEALVLPLRDIVVFPHMVTPVFVAREASLLAIQEAHEHDRTIIGLTQRDPDVEDPGPQDFLPIGVEMAVGRLLSMPDGSSSALVQGRRRVEVVEFTRLTPVLKVRARVIEEPTTADKTTQALMRNALDLFDRCVQLDRAIPEEAHLFAMNISEPGWLADMIATAVSINLTERQQLLLMKDARQRLQRINKLLAQELDVLELEDEIHSRVQDEVDKSQREFYLREQMKQIQTELGEGDIFTRDLNDLKKKIEAASLPEQARTTAIKELERLNQMPPMAPEVGIIRTYLDWILDLPWQKSTEDNLDVKHAARILERDHYGLKKAKDRILEYIAVRSLKPKKERQPILCFVGPPGTGKTSLGQSIAESLGRKFVRVSLGGVRDEAEIRGHRRTYIGALPGRILQTMKRAGTANPLFMLDEIDKLGQDFRGDPSSALLEVLDPEQNHAFSDHYLELDFDLSKVMFITTANTLMTIPPALLDRMEVIEFPGYIEEEKLIIADRFLIPRQLEESGIEVLGLSFTTEALQRIVREYTYEAGVRNLEREIGRICRKVARWKAEEKRYPTDHPAGADREIPRPAAVLPDRGRAQGRSGRGHRPGLDRERRRDHVHRSGRPGWQGQPADDRSDRGRDAGIGPGRADLRQIAGDPAGDRPRSVRAHGYPRAHAGGRHPEGWPISGHHPGNGAHLRADRATCPQGSGHDRRDHPARACAAHRRVARKGAGCPPRRAEGGAHPGEEHERPGGCAQEGARGFEDHPHSAHGPGARNCPCSRSGP